MIGKPNILLPRTGDLTAWSVIACDQFTAEPEYWAEADALAGEKPSALRLMLPEAWLGTERASGAGERIARTMERYLAEGVFEELPASFVYLERTQPDGRVRRGLMAAVDLEAYDYRNGALTPVRATEGTVEERLPPRMEIRRRSALEMPHAMVLMDDRDDRVLGPLAGAKHRMRKVYDFELMLGGGHLAGWQVRGPLADCAQAALCSLAEPELQREKYGEAAAAHPLVLAVGDGNHSLAAARRCWEELRPELTPAQRENHPARFALAELVNIHEPALDFEPIHRVLFDTDTEAFRTEYAVFSQHAAEAGYAIGALIGAAEAFCQRFVREHGGRIDYIHGEDTARALGAQPGCAAVLLPAMGKEELFDSVVRSGAFPRKSFSMGHARDKRYYLECRRITAGGAGIG